MKKLSVETANESHLNLVDDIWQMITIEAQQNNMVTQSPEAIKEQITKGDAILAFMNGQVVGYVCLEHWTNYIEIGALTVKPNYRQHRIGTKLTQSVLRLALSKYPEKSTIILPNQISSQIMLKLGFVEKEKDFFDPEIWSLCSACIDQPNFPNCRCQAMIWPNHKEK